MWSPILGKAVVYDDAHALASLLYKIKLIRYKPFDSPYDVSQAKQDLIIKGSASFKNHIC